MTPGKQESPEEILRDSTDIARLRRMGITDFALMTFFVHLQDGLPRDQALSALLNGRSLTRKDKDMIRTILSRLPIR